MHDSFFFKSIFDETRNLYIIYYLSLYSVVFINSHFQYKCSFAY